MGSRPLKRRAAAGCRGCLPGMRCVGHPTPPRTPFKMRSSTIHPRTQSSSSGCCCMWKGWQVYLRGSAGCQCCPYPAGGPARGQASSQSRAGARCSRGPSVPSPPSSGEFRSGAGTRESSPGWRRDPPRACVTSSRAECAHAERVVCQLSGGRVRDVSALLVPSQTTSEPVHASGGHLPATCSHSTVCDFTSVCNAQKALSIS